MVNYAELDGSIWYDGEYMPHRQAMTHVLTHTLHYGLGIYEGIRAYASKSGPLIFRLEDHIDRFYHSAKIIHMKLPFPKDTLMKVCQEILVKNNVDSAYLRPMAFYGSEGMGLHTDALTPHIIIATWAWGEYMGKGALENGVRIHTSTFARNHVNSMLSKAKVAGHYVNSMLALQEAQACGYDDALMLDHSGFVSEGSGANIFVYRNGELATPNTGTILEGITRDTVIKMAAELDIPLVQRPITRDEIYIADEAFFTGTAAEISPIVELDNIKLADGKPGPVSRKLQQHYFAMVRGELDNYQSWNTRVK